MSYRVSTEQVGGRAVLKLHDDASGASASVLPSVGFNLFDLRLPVAGKVRPVVASTDDFAKDPTKPSHSGTPVLFPFPNRIREGRFTFAGKTYQLPANNGPNAIHGFAIAANWDVVEHKADASGAVVAGRYQISKHSPAMRALWPTDGILDMRYRLAEGRLTLDVRVSNPTGDDFPYGWGIHPYFWLPLDPSGDPAKTEVILPASEYWALKDLLPTGERKPVDARLDFRKGQPLKGLKLDDVLTGMHAQGGVCRLVDRALGAEFRLGFDKNIRELVVFTPPWFAARSIAVEPYTQATDAINLEPRGIDAGLRVLKHGEAHEFAITMETKS
jgi:aldose 1-epimerase